MNIRSILFCDVYDLPAVCSFIHALFVCLYSDWAAFAVADCLVPPPVYHVKIEKFRQLLFPKVKHARLPVFSSQHSFRAKVRAGKRTSVDNENCPIGKYFVRATQISDGIALRPPLMLSAFPLHLNGCCCA